MLQIETWATIPEAFADIPSEEAAAEPNVDEDKEEEEDEEVLAEEQGDEDERWDPAADVEDVEPETFQGDPEDGPPSWDEMCYFSMLLFTNDALILMSRATDGIITRYLILFPTSLCRERELKG